MIFEFMEMFSGMQFWEMEFKLCDAGRVNENGNCSIFLKVV